MLSNRWLLPAQGLQIDKTWGRKHSSRSRNNQKKPSPSQWVRTGQLVREEDTPGGWKSTVGKAGRRMRCSVKLVRSARSRASLQSTHYKKRKTPKGANGQCFLILLLLFLLSSATFPFLCNSSSKPYGSRIKVGGKYHLSPHHLKAGESPWNGLGPGITGTIC